jgi:hypothetical protein
MATPALRAERTAQEQAKRIPRGSRVEVGLKTHRNVQGRLGEVTQSRLSLEPLDPGSGPASTYLFQDVSKIRSIEPKPAWKRTLQTLVMIPFRALEITVMIVVCVTTAPFGGSCDE